MTKHEIYRAGNVRYQLVHLIDGDKFYRTDLNVINKARAEQVIRLINDGANASDWHMDYEDKLAGYNDIGFYVLREITEPEMNEFGEISP